MEENRFSEIIATAIQREEEAYAFYMDLSGKVSDKSATETIEWIADEEKKHKEFLVSYRDGGYASDALQLKEVALYKIAEHQQEPVHRRAQGARYRYIGTFHPPPYTSVLS